MKKKKILITVIIVLILILIIPVPSGVYKDGGTRAYTSLTYKIVDWNVITADNIYDKIKIYFFPDNFKSVDELWQKEEENALYSFDAKVLEVNEKSVLVEPLEGERERSSSDKISFATGNLKDIGVTAGSYIKITYGGEIMESYPAQIIPYDWDLIENPDKSKSNKETETWLDPLSTAVCPENFIGDIVITEIYEDCFFGEFVFPSPYKIKFNGSLSDEWCVGDKITPVYENAVYNDETGRIEADFISATESDFEPEPGVAYKPVIYLYPQRETKVNVKLDYSGELTCTYPEYNGGWTVTASPGGTLTDNKGQTYNYLYWEGKSQTKYDMSKGFCVKGEDTGEFLETALNKLGLNRREANEFIVFWLPLMQDNKYNLISFQTDSYTESAKLYITPKPDTLIRVFMAYKPLEEYTEIEEQILSSPERTGFTAVEWGGAKVS